MSIIDYNAALRLRELLPEGVLDNSENFVEFLKAYYEWLHTSTFDITQLTGTFTSGEFVVGQSSKSTGRIAQLKTGQIIVFVESSVPFRRGETLVGQTSGATATLNGITDNVLRTAANLIKYRDLEESVDKFADYLKFELYQSVPTNISGDKILLSKKIRDFYQSKSQQQAYKYLFKSLYNQEIDIIYPGEDILRVSDGKFSQTKVLRAVVTGDIFNFLFKTVRGVTSDALANVVDVKIVFIGTLQVAEMTLTLVSGTFIAGETIFDINDIDLTTTLYGVIADFTINDPGTGYNINDELIITGDGQSASVLVSSVFQSPIDKIKINSTGYGYRLNTYATVNNSGTDGTGLIVKVTGIEDTYTVTSGANNYTVGRVSDVRIVNKGSNYRDVPTITLEDTTIKSLGLLSDGLLNIANTGTNYAIGNWLTFSGGTGSSANAIIASVTEANTTLSEDGTTILLESSYYLKDESSTLRGPIRRIQMTNYGTGYTMAGLPSIVVNTSTGVNASIIVTGIQGTGANVQVDVANNSGGIGAIRSIAINDFGAGYTTATVDATGVGNGDANVTPILSGIGITEGQFTNNDGKIDYKRIQDSYYYQDFSYVIRSGIEISSYKEVLKKIIHPAGLEFFGEIGIVSEIDVTVNMFSDISLGSIGAVILGVVASFDVKAEIAPNNNQKIEIKMSRFNEAKVERAPGYTWGQIDVGYVFESPISDYSNVTFSTPFDEYFGNAFAIIPLYYLANSTLSTYSANTFLSPYSEIIPSNDLVYVYKKITGTVSSFGNNTILGLGTSFNTEIFPENFIIIGNDRYQVSSVSSNTSLTVVLDSTTNYTNSSAYRSKFII